MTDHQKQLRTFFGYAAIASSAVFITLAPVLLRSPLPHATSRFHAEPFGLLLIAMRELILVMPLVVAFVNGMAWWAFRKDAPSARQWAIRASVSFVVLSAPFFVADVAIMQYSMAGFIGFAGVLLLAVALLSLGIVGLAAFGKRDALFVANSSRRHSAAEANGLGALAPTM